MDILTEIAIVGVIGMILQMLMKARSIQTKAKLANIQFKFWSYFTEDWISHLISLFALALYVFLARRRVVDAPVSMYEYILGLSASVGYMGADLVSRFFSFANKRINAAIDHKTTIADNSVGVDPNIPTPATKPVNAAHSFSEGSDMK
jgi:hypothetical protein